MGSEIEGLNLFISIQKELHIHQTNTLLLLFKVEKFHRIPSGRKKKA